MGETNPVVKQFKNENVHLINGRFADVVNGCLFDPSVSVVIRGGKIRAMPGLPGEPAGLDDCRTVDLQGKTVIPGLFNTHCHLQLIGGLLRNEGLRYRQMEKNLADCLEFGITNIRDAWAPDLQINRRIVDRVKKGEIPGPRVYQSVAVSPEGGNCAPKLNPFMRYLLSFVENSRQASGCVAFRPDAPEREVRDAVNRAIDERGADCIKFYDQHQKFMSSKPGGVVMTDGQLAAAADQALLRGVPTTIHHTRVSLFRRDIKSGVTSLAHLPQDELLTEDDLEAFLASGCYIEPTLSVSYALCYGSLAGVPDGYSKIRELEEFREETLEGMLGSFWLPEMASRYRKQVEKYAGGSFKMMGVLDFSAPFRRYTASMPVIDGNIRSLYKKCKHRIACGNDATLNFYTQASIRLEFDLLKMHLCRDGAGAVEAADLLRIATIQSAKAMKLDNSFGSIETGKRADLVILDGNPLEDSRLVGSRASAVFLDGVLAINRCGLQII